ncbi:hypothetical protein ACFX13_022413 [Malus domestica]
MCYDKPRRRSLATSSHSSFSPSSSSLSARLSKMGPTSSPSSSTATLLSNPSSPASTSLASAIPTTSLPDLQPSPLFRSLFVVDIAHFFTSPASEP